MQASPFDGLSFPSLLLRFVNDTFDPDQAATIGELYDYIYTLHCLISAQVSISRSKLLSWTKNELNCQYG